MILQRLKEYADRTGIVPPPMYERTPIPWLVNLDEDGRFLGIIRTTGGGKRDRGTTYVAPAVSRSGKKIAPNLLSDRADYALGYRGVGDDERSDAKTQEAHRRFCALVRECAEATGDPSVRAVCRFLSEPNLGSINLPQELAPGEWVTFSVAGMLPISQPSVQEFWAERNMARGAAAQCLVCGRVSPPARIHPVKIKGVAKGKSAGMTLVSANRDGFESYGLTQSLIAPTCTSCAERYATAVNHLLRDSATHLRVGSADYLFWTKEEIGFSLASLLRDPQLGEVRELMKSVLTGRSRAAELDANPFYATALSSSGARVTIRDWIETTVGNVQQNVIQYFDRQRTVDAGGSVGLPLGLEELASSLVRTSKGRPAMDQLPNRVPQSLFRSAIHGSALPFDLLDQAVRRARAEKAEMKVTYPRAAVMKMVLISQHCFNLKEDAMQKLDPTNQHPAYLCGRLFRVLESVQRAAIPGSSATIVERFYGSASSAPASVFGTLLHGSQAHLSKLRKTREGAYHALEQQLEEVLGGLSEFPATLDMKQQALFALGYYHQRAQDRADAAAHRKRKSEESDES